MLKDFFYENILDKNFSIFVIFRTTFKLFSVTQMVRLFFIDDKKGRITHKINLFFTDPTTSEEEES